jgi:hypothetical protein
MSNEHRRLRRGWIEREPERGVPHRASQSE